MGRVRRVVIGVIAVALLVAALALGGGWLWLRGGLPDYTGTVAVSGLTGPVRVVRDARGIPRIQAGSMDDAYVALGFVHAQDRLWQMDMTRRLGAGRVAEIFPADFRDWAIRQDRATRALGLYRLAESSVAALAPEVRRALERYAAGVNAYLETRRGPLPIEFQILGYRPEPWRPADTLVWGKLEALQLAGNFRDELLRARLLTRLPASQVDELLPRTSAGGAVTLAGDLEALGGRFAAMLDGVAAALPAPLGPAPASNEWVIGGAHTVSGKPILANDPHLGLSAPSPWYLARIETPELVLSGATAPGVPFHLLGHNESIAWGVTMPGSDTQDLFVERLAANDPTRYLTPTGARPFDTRAEVIKVRGRPDQTLIVRATRHGPVLPEDGSMANAKAPPGHVLALAFTGLSSADTSAEAIYRLNRARDWDGFAAALRFHQAPQGNFVYADTSGAIGFLAPGVVPIRARGDGLVPVPGWTGAYDWTGTIPFDALPRAVDPPSGRLVNANNRVVGPDYPYLLAARWPDDWRAGRINALLDRRDRQSVSTTVAAQLDVTSPAALRLVPHMLPREGADTQALSRTAQAAVALLRRWDGGMSRHQPEPLIYSWWLRAFDRALFAERLGPLYAEYQGSHPRVIEHVLTEAPSWCERPSAPGARACSDLLRASLETTVRALAERYGESPAAWHWGSEHVAPFEHPLLARVPLLGRLFALDLAADGDAHTVNMGAGGGGDARTPFADLHGPGLRAVYDLDGLNGSLFMIAPGQSGNPLSPHYGDLARSWRDGAAITLGGAATSAAVETMVLLPQSR